MVEEILENMFGKVREVVWEQLPKSLELEIGFGNIKEPLVSIELFEVNILHE